MNQPSPPPFTGDQTRIIESYQRLRTLVAGPPPTQLVVDPILSRPSGPTISAVEPKKGSEGDSITIRGTGLQTARKVFFGATSAQITYPIGGQSADVVVKVPHIEPLPVTVKVAVETDCGTTLSPVDVDFTVEAGNIVEKKPRGG